jgi:hypothetical protein
VRLSSTAGFLPSRCCISATPCCGRSHFSSQRPYRWKDPQSIGISISTMSPSLCGLCCRFLLLCSSFLPRSSLRLGNCSHRDLRGRKSLTVFVVVTRNRIISASDNPIGIRGRGVLEGWFRHRFVLLRFNDLSDLRR